MVTILNILNTVSGINPV